MSSSTPADTTAPAATPPPAKKKSKLLLIVAVVCCVALGCGFFMYRTFAAAPAKIEKGKKKRAGKDAEKETPAKESEEQADDHDDEGKKAEGDHEEDTHDKPDSGGKDALASSLPDDDEVKHIVSLEPFIVNLADEGEARYLRLSVNLGTGEGEGGEEKEKPDPLFTARVRNAMLSVLMTKRSSEVLTVEGKNALRKELLRAAQAASEEPHVEAIYITDFIVQL